MAVLRAEIELGKIEIGEPRENDIEVWTVAVGNVPTIYIYCPFLMPKEVKEAVKFICKLDGFCGLFDLKPHGTLCMFESENKAKIARNMMRDRGIEVGNNICSVYIDKDECTYLGVES